MAFGTDNFLHVVYRCNTADTGIVGYAHDLFGSWSRQAVATYSSPTSTVPPVVAVDSSSTLHVAWADGSVLLYTRGNALMGTLNTPVQVAFAPGNYTSVQMLANGPNDVKILSINSSSGGFEAELNYGNGTLWTTQPVTASAQPIFLARGFVQR